MSLFGVTVRWSLHATAHPVAEQLRAYVAEAAATRRHDLPSLHRRLWTLREGGSFGETYVWTSAQARADFVRQLRRQGNSVNVIIGHSPDAIEEFDVLAITEESGARAAVPAPAPEQIRRQWPQGELGTATPVSRSKTGTGPPSGPRSPAS